MRIIVLTDDRVGPLMAGSALRAWELARALRAAGHVVCLAAAPGSEPPAPDGPNLVPRPPWRWAEALVCPPWCLPPRAFLGRRLLVVDGVTPLLAELDCMHDSPLVARRKRTAFARMPLVLARADAVLVAGEAQAQWWRQRLEPLRPGVPLIHVPFGIPDEDPPAERDEVPGIPPDWAIVLWWGGVWPWLDLDTLLAARAVIGAAPLSVVVPTARRPGSHGARFSSSELDAAAQRHGLRHPQVVSLDQWIPYAERHRILHRTSLLAVLHHDGEETDLSFRTRALDGVWAGVPLLVSEGGEVSRLVRTYGWGGVVPVGNATAVAATLELMLSEREQLRCRKALAASRPEWTWSQVAAPLAEDLSGLPAVSRRPLAGAALRSALALLGHGLPGGKP